MKSKKLICLLMVLVFSVVCLTTNVSAAGTVRTAEVFLVSRATGSFNMTISGNTLTKASTSFPLESGEIVTIKASYSPFSASVDFGLIGPGGSFHYVRVSNGTVSKEIEINTSGNYTLAIRNNSSQTVKVSGFVNY